MVLSPLLLAATVAPPWPLLVPFFALLGLIALGPLLFAKLWEKSYTYVAVGLGLLMLLYYGLVLHDWHTAAETLAEYFSFVALLTALFVVGGTMYLNINLAGTPRRNVILLALGAILASLIGTTGASLLLIRPLIRLNDQRVRPYQVVFFIFLVSNAGGLLTPLGDPPLFIGFLRGVPFFWTSWHLLVPWLLTTSLLLLLFWFRDRKTPYPSRLSRSEQRRARQEGGLPLYDFHGRYNLIWLLVVLGAVFLDPARLPWLPAISLGGMHISFVREIIQLLAAWGCYRTASPKALSGNHFTFGPIQEVAFLFFGIFLTMIPALQTAAHIASKPAVAKSLTPTALYWLAGMLSAFLDNAPTYASFLSLSMAGYNLHFTEAAAVQQFAESAATMPLLRAISCGAVLFGALTYIGNGPNFLVRSIADKEGVPMPSFFAYIGRFAVPYLLPILGVVSIWLLFS
ncbi:citrate transporter [Hymenobacter taeanensis]|uniref:Citrate transporter n=1 Tax=Hymenobacter taeanensis TaxID=2735321 RepID=A0A6M6BCU4_9BACT|nr:MULTISPECIES: sodium:proton antiporter [Hymenobacter]QJX46016.1 citrate transporter [Hymenobacter taeanensis]UOQ79869.1 sodium:proton antiporter [Hymenobacter sp. 5414T-23]